MIKKNPIIYYLIVNISNACSFNCKIQLFPSLRTSLEKPKFQKKKKKKVSFQTSRCHRKTLPIFCHSFDDSCTTSSKFRARLISSPSCSWLLAGSCTGPTRKKENEYDWMGSLRQMEICWELLHVNKKITLGNLLCNYFNSGIIQISQILQMLFKKNILGKATHNRPI